ncbi:MAG: hypothetical protein QGH12_00050 [SAR324 cluster bacterium]|nr:hypothetical protein [SAR324 cluster bacterium]
MCDSAVISLGACAVPMTRFSRKPLLLILLALPVAPTFLLANHGLDYAKLRKIVEARQSPFSDPSSPYTGKVGPKLRISTIRRHAQEMSKEVWKPRPPLDYAKLLRSVHEYRRLRTRGPLRQPSSQ